MKLEIQSFYAYTRVIFITFCALALNFAYHPLFAASLDGTITQVYQNTHWAFHRGTDNAQGFVRFNQGFTVLPDASVLLDTFVTVSGAIDLRSTGTMILLHDLALASNVTVSAGGGNISGRGNTIYLGGNLTLPARIGANSSTIIHIQSDTIIDGQGHSLIIGADSQLFIDTNVTLSLRNIIVKNSSKSVNFPAIRCASLRSKLSLDRVWMSLDADFNFPMGQLFISNDVSITGTSAFVYQSPSTSFINPRAMLYFDQGTTLSYAPSINSRDLIVMQDTSSMLYLNGASLACTHTGLRLTTGTLLLDNRVPVNTLADYDLNTTTIATQVGSNLITGSGPIALAWSPNEQFVALVNVNDSTLQLFKFNGSSTPIQLGSNVTTGAGPFAVAWSPDGRFISVVSGGNTLQIFAFNPATTPVQIGSTVTTGTTPQGVVWSPDGKFLAVTNFGGNTLQIYTFNGVNTPTTIGSPVTTGAGPYSLAWSPDGRFIAIVNYTAGNLQIFTSNGTTTPTQVGSNVTVGTNPAGVVWSPDGRFVGLINYNGGSTGSLQIFTFNGTTTPTQVAGTVTTGNGPLALTWSPDGRFIGVVNSADNTLQVYVFSGSSTPTAVGSTITTDIFPQAIAWAPSGKFISLVTNNNSLQVFKLNTIKATNAQAISQGLVFGNASQGATSDLNVQLLSGARIELNGNLNDNSF